MYIVHVHVKVQPGCEDRFIQASVENARNSVLEAGVARFDVIQSLENPAHFVLVEIYKTEEDARKHKETRHYERWRDAVADLMAEPRYGIKYHNLYPEDQDWK